MALTVGLTIQDKLNRLVGTLAGSTNIDQSQTSFTGSNTFGDNGTGQQLAQTFVPQKDFISGIIFQRSTNTLSPVSDVQVQIQETTAGLPNGTVLATTTILAAAWDANLTSTDITVNLAAVVVPGTVYAIVFVPSVQDAANYRRIVASSSNNYLGATAQRCVFNGTTWSGSGGDFYFKTLYGGLGNSGALSQTECLNILNATTGENKRDAWNRYAGTTGRTIQDAANIKAGTTGLRVQDCVNLL